MQIFQAIYDKNYYIFETSEYADMIYDNNNLNIDDSEIEKLMSYESIDQWLQLFNLYNEDTQQSYSDSEDNDCYSDHIGEERIYNRVPHIETSYYRSNKKQKIYTISDIKQLLDK